MKKLNNSTKMELITLILDKCKLECEGSYDNVDWEYISCLFDIIEEVLEEGDNNEK